MSKWDLFLECRNGSTYEKTNVIHYINKIKGKKKAISTNAEAAFNKIQHPFMIKTVSKLGRKLPQHNISHLFEHHTQH